MKMKQPLFRTLVISFWLAILVAALYLPRLEWNDFEKNSITVFTWGDIFEPDVVKAFEKETGIKVHLNYYSSNEELIVKLKATRAEGYDLIVPSDYAVQILIRENLLKRLDHKKLGFWKDLNPLLLSHFYDPKNEYSIPFEWEIFGLGIDKDFFASKKFKSSWDLIFNPKIIDYRIGMLNDPIESVLLAAYYLYGFEKKQDLTPEQEIGIRDLLVRQHAWVAAYADFRIDYLLATKNCPVVTASSSYILRTVKKFPFVKFVVPEEGTFITIENLCIPAGSEKQDLVYRFMNYLYTRESSATHFNTFGFFPSTTHAFDLMELDAENKALMLPSKEQFDKYFFVEEIMPESDIRDIWVDVKSR